MIYIKTNLISGLIKIVFEVVALLIKYLFKILKSLHLRLLFTICLVGAFLEIVYSRLSGNATYLIVFLTLVGFAFVRFLFLNLENHFVSSINIKKPIRSEEIQKEEIQKPQFQEEIPPTTNVYKAPININKKPLYYRVSQNPKYVMAEYNDRYELFYESENGLKYIRTDYKNNSEEYNE